MLSRVRIRYERSADVYHLAYEHLKQAATQGRNEPYEQLAWTVGLPLSGEYMSREVGHLCGVLSRAMHTLGLPMLSAIVVRSDTHMPGDGFFALAESLGKLYPGANENAKYCFWERERAAVFATPQWP
jgi:hypothetical protein